MKRRMSSRVIGRLRERSDERAPPIAARHPFGSSTVEPSVPIFVIGAQRSGTSLLRRILDSHSSIACPAESKFILPLTAMLNDRKAMFGLASMGYERAQVEEALAGFIRSFFDNYAASRGKRRWAEKTPNYVDCLMEIWDLFGPRVQFVIIVRHGLDAAFSLADPHRHYPAVDRYLAQADGNLPVAAGLFWADKNSKIEKLRELRPEACFRLRFEDLTNDPAGTLRPMFDFLGEPWEPAVIDYDKFPHHAGYGDPDVKRRRRIESNSGKHRSWPSEVQAAVRDACGPMLGRLGYDD
jgi:Sulfotransferase family